MHLPPTSQLKLMVRVLAVDCLHSKMDLSNSQVERTFCIFQDISQESCKMFRDDPQLAQFWSDVVLLRRFRKSLREWLQCHPWLQRIQNFFEPQVWEGQRAEYESAKTSGSDIWRQHMKKTKFESRTAESVHMKLTGGYQQMISVHGEANKCCQVEIMDFCKSKSSSDSAI